MKWLKRIFCTHDISMEICQIKYHANSTELVYTKRCKYCGKVLSTRIKNIDKNGNKL